MTAMTLPVKSIHPNARNPRAAVGDTADLEASIKARGLLQPVVVYKTDDGYTLKAGHRRLVACQKLGLTEIPAVEVDADDEAGDVFDALVENMHRADLTDGDRANGVQALFDLGAGVQKIASTLRLPQAQVKALNQARHSHDEAKQALTAGDLTLDALLALQEFESIPELWEPLARFAAEGRNVEHEVKGAKRILASRAAADEARAKSEDGGPAVFTDATLASYDGKVKVFEYYEMEADEHAKCPGHALYLVETTSWLAGINVPEPHLRTACTQPKLHGARGSDEPLTPEQAEAAKEARREVIRRNKEGESANEVRREWIAALLARRAMPKEALVYATRIIAIAGDGNQIGATRVVGQALKVSDKPYPDAGEVAAAVTDNASATRALVALALAVAEEKIDKTFWRDRFQFSCTEAHLRGLASMGYTLSHAEQTFLDEREASRKKK